jgi:hypothetical protein
MLKQLLQLKKNHPEYPVFGIGEDEFKRYGRPLDSGAWRELVNRTGKLIRADEDPAYLPSCPELEDGSGGSQPAAAVFGSDDVQIGVCRGFNNSLNGMEWHDCPEIIVACTPLVLILGHKDDISGGKWSSDGARLCFMDSGEAVEIHPGTLHFAPSRLGAEPFLSIIVLPRGVNGELPSGTVREAFLWKARKWLIAHPDSPQGAAGAVTGITGKNIRIAG